MRRAGRVIAPVYAALSKAHPEVTFTKVDIDNADVRSVVEKHQVTGVVRPRPIMRFTRAPTEALFHHMLDYGADGPEDAGAICTWDEGDRAQRLHFHPLHALWTTRRRKHMRRCQPHHPPWSAAAFPQRRHLYARVILIKQGWMQKGGCAAHRANGTWARAGEAVVRAGVKLYTVSLLYHPQPSHLACPHTVWVGCWPVHCQPAAWPAVFTRSLSPHCMGWMLACVLSACCIASSLHALPVPTLFGLDAGLCTPAAWPAAFTPSLSPHCLDRVGPAYTLATGPSHLSNLQGARIIAWCFFGTDTFCANHVA
eukprot:366503-Chlamydomonas_euryale.AAC.14